MNGPAVKKLISIASDSIETSLAGDLPQEFASTLGRHSDDLSKLLNTKNGFFCFESALHVYPINSPSPTDILRWNSENGWKQQYKKSIRECVFFAQDIFANQFGLDSSGLWAFDPELGTKKKIADNIEDWAGKLLLNYNEITGHSVAHEWQIKNSPLSPEFRLAPKTPFILGGEFTCNNLFAAKSTECMDYYGHVYRQTKDLKDGEVVRLKIIK